MACLSGMPAGNLIMVLRVVHSTPVSMSPLFQSISFISWFCQIYRCFISSLLGTILSFFWEKEIVSIFIGLFLHNWECHCIQATFLYLLIELFQQYNTGLWGCIVYFHVHVICFLETFQQVKGGSHHNPPPTLMHTLWMSPLILFYFIINWCNVCSILYPLLDLRGQQCFTWYG